MFNVYLQFNNFEDANIQLATAGGDWRERLD